MTLLASRLPSLLLFALALGGLSEAQVRPLAGQGRAKRPVAGGAEIPQLLRKAIQQAPKLRYSGERVVEFKRGGERKRHREFVLKDGPRMRIEFPDDSEFAGQIIVESQAVREHYFPGRNEIRVMAPRHDEAFARLRRLVSRLGKDGVRFVHGNPDSVAGIRTASIGIADGHGNPLMRLWIDPRNGMVLKRELYDHVGGLVGLLEYVRLDYEPLVRPDEFVIRREGARRVTAYDDARKLMRENAMLEVFLPEDEGLRLDNAHVIKAGDRPVLVQVYQGPEGPVSFYQLQGPLSAERLRAQAGPEFQTHIWRMRGKTFAIVAEMEASRLERIAAKLRDR